MNETLNTLMTRRSVRAFQTEKNISREDLQAIVDAGRYAPSAMNRQTWTFVVIQNQEKIQSLAHAVGKALGRDSGYNFYLPNTLILCANDLSANPMGVQDCACALENMFLAAHSLGIGSVWINQLYDTCNEPEVRRQLTALGLPESATVIGCAALGYAAAAVEAHPKKDESETVVWNL